MKNQKVYKEVKKFVEGVTDLASLKAWVQIPNRPDCGPEVLSLLLSPDGNKVREASMKVELLRQQLGMTYDQLQPILQSELAIG